MDEKNLFDGWKIIKSKNDQSKDGLPFGQILTRPEYLEKNLSNASEMCEEIEVLDFTKQKNLLEE